MNKRLSFLVLVALVIVIGLAFYLNEKQKVKNDKNQIENINNSYEYYDDEEKEAEEEFEKAYEAVEKYLQEKSMTIESMEIIGDGRYKLVYLEGTEQKETEVSIKNGEIEHIEI